MAKVLTRAQPADAVLDETRADLAQQIADVTTKLDRLVEALMVSGVSPTLTAKLKKLETAKADLEDQLAGLDRQGQVSEIEVARLGALARSKAAEWRGLLGRHTPQARQILGKMLRDKLTFRPETRQGQQGWRFTGEGTVTILLAGMVPELSHVVASPAGFEPAVSTLKGSRARPLHHGDNASMISPSMIYASQEHAVHDCHIGDTSIARAWRPTIAAMITSWTRALPMIRSSIIDA